MDGKIKSGDKEILSAGTFITFDESHSVISIRKGKEKVYFELHFIDDPKTEPKFEVSSEGNKKEFTIILKLYNFNHGLGIGFTQAVRIAEFDNGDPIYINLRVKTLENSVNKEVSYTIYSGKNG